MVCRPQGASLYSIPHIPEFVFLTACSTLFKSEPESQDEYPDVSEFIRLSVPHVCCCFSGQELSDSFLRRRRPPFCRTACERRMLSESGLAALRLTSPSRGMTALWCSLWLFFLLPLCVAPARLPTAQPTGRIETPQHLFYTTLAVGFKSNDEFTDTRKRLQHLEVSEPKRSRKLVTEHVF